MSADQKPGTQILVTGCANRELPSEVKNWLRQNGERVLFSPHIYDTLAELTRGLKPRLLLVHVDALDWNELDFFTHAARLSRETRFYIIGPKHRDKKMEAACTRGARIFSPDQIMDQPGEEIASPTQKGNAGDLLAGSLQPSPQQAMPNEKLQNAPQQHPVPSPQESSPKPSVRLVRPYEETVAAKQPAPEQKTPVVFPWSPAKNRPKRTPPQHQKQSSSSSEDQNNQPPSQEQTQQSPPPQQQQQPSRQTPPNKPERPPIVLTTEELEALTGQLNNKNQNNNGPGQEQSQC
jgi:hypothetical protein